MCHQAVGLVQGALESAGVVTTGISLMPEISERVGVPRFLAVPHPLGYPLGRPGDAELQRRILLSALELIEDTAFPATRSFSED